MSYYGEKREKGGKIGTRVVRRRAVAFRCDGDVKEARITMTYRSLVGSKITRRRMFSLVMRDEIERSCKIYDVVTIYSSNFCNIVVTSSRRRTHPHFGRETKRKMFCVF